MMGLHGWHWFVGLGVLVAIGLVATAVRNSRDR
jgi:hypothetical protein